MDITRRIEGGRTILAIAGRVDSYWSGHLAGELETLLREGADSVTLDFSGVPFMSSAGISVLLQYYRKFTGMGGSMDVIHPTDLVQSVMELSGIAAFLLQKKNAQRPPVAEDTAVQPEPFSYASFPFDLFPLKDSSSFRCRVIGDSAPLDSAAFIEEDCSTVKFPSTSFGLGIGALGTDFSDCRNRFGEFVSIAGASVFLPTDGTNTPDYSIATGTFIPEMNVLYGIQCEGEPAFFSRFETNETTGEIPLSDLMGSCLAATDAETIGMVFLAETTGLIGSALKRSPALSGLDGSIFTHPQVREWMSFTVDPVFPRSMVFGAGIATRRTRASLEQFLRPVGAEGLRFHAHAVACGYRPMKKGLLSLSQTVETFFESPDILGLLHLMNDDRHLVGLGESMFLRGGCWFGPIAGIEF